MLLGTATSKNNVKIRLTEERWLHITMSHPEMDTSDFSLMLNIIKSPDSILKGYKDELLAIEKNLEKQSGLW